MPYQPQAEDTSVAADRHLFKLLSQRSTEQRWAMTVQQTQAVMGMSLAGLEWRFGQLSEPEFARKAAQVWLGDHWPTGFEPKGKPMNWIQDSIGLAQRLHGIFESLNIQYYVTGGVAATAYGEPRPTIDLDLVINVLGTALYPVVTRLESEGFYITGVDDVVAGRMQTLPITDQETIARADLVISGNGPWDAIMFARRQRVNAVYLASPEDIILSKLRWGRRSQSEKQWRDVLGIFKVQGEALDVAYMRVWANTLGIERELEEAILASGGLGEMIEEALVLNSEVGMLNLERRYLPSHLLPSTFSPIPLAGFLRCGSSRLSFGLWMPNVDRKRN